MNNHRSFNCESRGLLITQKASEMLDREHLVKFGKAIDNWHRRPEIDSLLKNDSPFKLLNSRLTELGGLGWPDDFPSPNSGSSIISWCLIFVVRLRLKESLPGSKALAFSTKAQLSCSPY